MAAQRSGGSGRKRGGRGDLAGTPGGAPAAGKARARAAAPNHRELSGNVRPLLDPWSQHAYPSADHFRLGAWAMQHPSSGLALIRGQRITATNEPFETLARTLQGTLVPSPVVGGGGGAGQRHTLREVLKGEARAVEANAGQEGRDRYARFRAAEGDQWIEILTSHVAREDGERFTVAVVRDITAQVKAGVELVAAQEALAHQEHMSAIGELTAGIVHDVSNTLGAIRLRLSALRRDPVCMGAQGPNLEALDRIISEGTAMLVRLQRLGQSTDQEAPVPVDLAEAIAGAVEIAQSGLRYRAIHDGVDIRIERDLPPLPSINAWPGDLQRVFVNLLINARDAMPRGGRIRISGGITEDHIVIRIEDEGLGIAVNAMPRIFEPYFTTKGGAGTGMGLAMAQRALARLGGSIAGDNRPEGGARFTLRFPIGGVPSSG